MENDYLNRDKFARIWKWLLVPLLILLLLAAGRWFVQSDYLLDKVRTTAEKQVGERLNGTLEIGSLTGDLLFGVQATDVRLRDEDGELLLSTDSLKVYYSLLRLLRQPHQVVSLRVDGMDVFIEQDADEIWNFEKLLPPSDIEEERDLPYWSVNHIQLNRSSVRVNSSSLPDSSLFLDGMDFTGHVGYFPDGWSASVHDFQFQIGETRLDRPVDVGMFAQLEGEKITLEQLLVRSGRSMVQSRAGIDRDRLEGELKLDPISWLDLKEYIELPLEQDLTASLDFRGRTDDLRVRLNLSAEGLESLELDSRLHLEDGPAVSDIELRVRELDGPRLTGDDRIPRLRSLGLTADGLFRIDSPERSTIAGNLTVEDISYAYHKLDLAVLDFDWLENRIDIQLEAGRDEQFLELAGSVQDLFEERPRWRADLSGRDINLATLLDEDDYDSNFRFTAHVRGEGFELSGEEIVVELDVDEGRWREQSFDRFRFDGSMTSSLIKGGAVLSLGRGQISADAQIDSWQELPAYRFEAALSDFNLSDLEGLDEFPTSLNATLEGEGRYFDLDNLELTTSMRFDSSIVNFERLDFLKARLDIENRVATVSDGELASAIADADFSLRQHLLDRRDPENSLQFQARLKNSQALAPLLGAETVRATGQLDGQLSRQVDGNLQFDGLLGLNDLAYDTLFAADRIEGTVSVFMLEEPEIDVGIEARNPVVQGYAIQSVTMSSRSVVSDTLVAGSLALEFIQDDQNAVVHGGDFEFKPDRFLLQTRELTLKTPDRELALQNPFDLTWQDRTLRMDTLHVRSSTGAAHLILAVPHLAEERQELMLDAELINLGTLQRSILGRSHVEAELSGRLDLFRTEEELNVKTSLQFRDIHYQNGHLDSLKVNSEIGQSRLIANLGAWHEDRQLLDVSGDVPFDPGDPLQFDDQFFEQPVSGHINMPATPVSFWNEFIGDLIDVESDGMLSFQSEISGTAGDPEFSGRLELREGMLSGVSLDSLWMNIDYRHETSDVSLDGSIHSLGTRIANFEALLPFHLDMRSFEVVLPDETDEVFVNFMSENFDLAILNDFLNRDRLRGLRGQLSGNVELRGPIGSLEPRGELNLRGGAIRIVETGVTFESITSSLQLEPDQIRIASLSARSGPGRLTASGTVQLTDIQPGAIDINIQANQFRVANTSDLNAIIDLNSRLRGTAELPELTGTLRFRSGFVFLRNFGERAVEDVTLEEDEERTRVEIYDSLAMEMNVVFNRQFFIRNRQYLDMEVELAGEVDLVKSPGADIELFGSIEGVRGYARPLGRNFQIEEAAITFYGPAQNPELNIRTMHRPPQTQEVITIWYIIEGPVEDPSFRFESEPYLELQDIVSYTLFGKPFYALDSWQQTVSGGSRGATAADVAVDLLLDRVELLAAHQLGIDVVQIDTNRSGAGSSTTIKTGWYLNNRTFFAILNEIGGSSPKTLFLLEYMLRENLELILTQGDDSREGIDLRWKYDY